MIVRHGKYTTLAAAVALLMGAAHAQAPDEDPAHGSDDSINAEHSTQTETEVRAGRESSGDLRSETAQERSESAVERSERAAEADLGDEAEKEIDRAEASERRQELQAMAERTVEKLEQSGEAGIDLENAHGYAVFDTTKGSLIVTGAGGSGIAKQTETDEETYMHVGAAGVGLGAGLENYTLVLVFEDGAAYEQFVDGQWDAGVSAPAAVGDEGASAEEQVVEDVEVYRIDDEGLIAQVDITGMRFWPSEELNERS